MLRRVQVAAVEDTTIQLMWGDAPEGPLTFVAERLDSDGRVSDGPGHRTETIVDDHPGGPGGIVLGTLRPATAHRLTLRAGRALDATRSVEARTLPAPPGAALARVATFSDTHIGAIRHGYFGTMRDSGPHADPAPVRCARAAIGEAVTWSPDLLVAKGDLTQRGWREEWARLGALVEAHGSDVPLVAVPGNHDTPVIREVAPQDGLQLAGLRSEPFLVVDLPGVRVLLVDSSIDARSGGTIAAHWGAVIDAARDADGAVLLCLHHPFERYPWPTKYPSGIPWTVTRRFLRDLGQANPCVVVTGGHTHRNRRFAWGPVVHTEVGSTKDYPGVWAGYVFHEGGVRQVVRRVMDPAALGWIEYSRLALGGLWQFYAPGRLADRCFTHSWPER